MSIQMTEAVIVEGRANALAHYPHARWAGQFLYISGTSSRRPDNTHVGAQCVDGVWELDIEAQTAAVIENLKV